MIQYNVNKGFGISTHDNQLQNHDTIYVIDKSNAMRNKTPLDNYFPKQFKKNIF